MTDAKPQEFARVVKRGGGFDIEMTNPMLKHPQNKSHLDRYSTKGAGEARANIINAAVAAHVRRAVEEFRERAAVRGYGAAGTPREGDEIHKAIMALPLEAEDRKP